MKVSKIEKQNSIYRVTLTPNWLEKLFGVKQKVRLFKDSGLEYLNGNIIYHKENGSATENGNYIAKAIDKWERRF